MVVDVVVIAVLAVLPLPVVPTPSDSYAVLLSGLVVCLPDVLVVFVAGCRPLACRPSAF